MVADRDDRRVATIYIRHDAIKGVSYSRLKETAEKVLWVHNL